LVTARARSKAQIVGEDVDQDHRHHQHDDDPNPPVAVGVADEMVTRVLVVAGLGPLQFHRVLVHGFSVGSFPA
jgi:hypothetical protein